MSTQSITRGYKGRGRFVLKPRAGNGRPFELGNVTSLEESIEVDRESRQNFQDAAGGELDVDEVITSYTFEATVNDISPQNLALALRGSHQHYAAQEIAAEPILAWADTRVAFKYLPDMDETIEVLKDAVPLVAGEDYERTPHGIRMLANPTNVSFTGDDPVELTVTYKRHAQYLIQALVNSGEEYEITWQGVNSVDQANPITGRYFRVRFSPTSGFQRHGGDDFAELTLSGTVLADENRTGQGESRFVETAMI